MGNREVNAIHILLAVLLFICGAAALMHADYGEFVEFLQSLGYIVVIGILYVAVDDLRKPAVR